MRKTTKRAENGPKMVIFQWFLVVFRPFLAQKCSNGFWTCFRPVRVFSLRFPLSKWERPERKIESFWRFSEKWKFPQIPLKDHFGLILDISLISSVEWPFVEVFLICNSTVFSISFNAHCKRILCVRVFPKWFWDLSKKVKNDLKCWFFVFWKSFKWTYVGISREKP